MRHQLRNPHFYIMIAGDACLFSLAQFLAYSFRFEFRLSPADFHNILIVLPYLIPLKIVVFYNFGLYRGMWRYTSIGDFWRLVQASLLSSVLVAVVALYILNFRNFSRAVFILDGVFTLLWAGGYRVAIRSFFSVINREGELGTWLLPWSTGKYKRYRRALIIGAGDAGEKLLREIFNNPHIQYRVAGFLDDDPKKRGRSVHGVRILGPVDKIAEVAEKLDIDEVLVAIPSASGEQMRRIVTLCKDCAVNYKTIPGMGEIIDGRVSIKTMRDVNYEDLLGREPVKLDIENIREYLANRVVLVTGCGGSIGSELCRQVVSYEPRELILVDASEANLFGIQMRLHHELHYQNYRTILGRVQDRHLMERVFRRYRPQVVFHAAAYKHVPMLEKQPWEAVHNNILGSQVAMEMAVECGASDFVLVSTDKAVRPSNVMGASKRVSELLLQSYQGEGTRFVAVRFGNVIGSSGSVIPLFRRQIEKGGPITVTHPEVTRYFMTIPEATQLILQAVSMGNGSGIFVLKMGTPVKIIDMARDLIQLSGKEPGRDIEIVFTGLREGEKLFEELLQDDENIMPTGHEKIMWLCANNIWNGLKTRDAFKDWLNRELRELYHCAEQIDGAAIKRKLSQIVPEYTLQQTESVL